MCSIIKNIIATNKVNPTEILAQLKERVRQTVLEEAVKRLDERASFAAIYSATYKTVSTIQGDISSVTYEIKLLDGDNTGGHSVSAPYKKVFDWHLRLKEDSSQ